MKKILFAFSLLFFSNFVAADSNYYFTSGSAKLNYTIPSGYVTDDDLHYRFSNFIEHRSPPANLLALFTTREDLNLYIETGEFPFFSKALITMGQLKVNMSINRSMFTSLKHSLLRSGYNIAQLSVFKKAFNEEQNWFNREFGTRHRARLESIKDLGMNIQSLNSVGVMGMVTYVNNNKTVKYVEAGGFYYYRNNVVVIGMNRRYSNDSDIKILEKEFKQIMHSFD